ncbi:uncharacterized protein LOC112087269 [Eutrema salsugineum]|uniref:uncharacterized protein LOC112087269 n=1 Tax=Eutrema salsugineum TaxID=72664 RepID=UPI000CED121E|nr:uncharacterized protein LOC112087269 [Eutrema salsugineum]
MVIACKPTRRLVRGTSSGRKSSNPEDSAPDSPISSLESPDNIDSPFYLTNGDNPGISLISEVLDGSNYDNWRIAMSIALDAKNKTTFIDGSIARPNEAHRNFRIWSRCNSMVKSWLLNSVSKQIYKIILRFNDASEIWKDLKARFHITNIPRSYQLSQQIWSLQQGSMDLASYYTTLKTLWDELDGANCVETCHNCSCCKATDTKAEHTKVFKFLADLNESYATIRTTFAVSAPDPSQASINAAQNTFNNQKQNRPICSHCGYNGHSVDMCYKIHGYPPNLKHKQKQSTDKASGSTKPVVAQVALNDSTSQAQTSVNMINTLTKNQIQEVIAYFNSQLQPSADSVNTGSVASLPSGTITALPGMAFSSSTLCFVGVMRSTNNKLSTASWIVDSGATHHVSHDRSLFESLSESVNKSVTLPTGLGVNIAGFGTVRLGDQLVLKNDPIKGLMIGQGEAISNLYVLDAPVFDNSTALQSSVISNVVLDYSLWHNRLGHPSIQKIDSLIHYQTMVKAVRSDNAPELRFEALFKSKGIISYHSCPETPEQNSVVERKHQHILNVACSLMFQSHVPLEYWGDCVLTAVFLINRLPTPLLQDKSPYEVLTSKRPDYKGLRVFGCLTYCSTSSKGRHKFQPRSRPCVFLGYPAGYKGYKLLDMETNKIHISKNVSFHEDIFPFTGQTDYSTTFFDAVLDSLGSSNSRVDIP